MARNSKATAQPKVEEPIKTESIEKPVEAEATAQPKVEEVANENVSLNIGVTKIMTSGEQPDGHNLVITAVDVSTQQSPLALHPNLIKVLIKYPKNWDKEKFMNDGDVKLCSQEVADQFVNLGIGNIQND